jgi:transcriptional regulator with XRE-family HTH domain
MNTATIADYKLFAEKLKAARHDADLTQVEAAELLRKPQSYVSKIESGERKVDAIELQYLARLYKKPLSYFEVKR